MGTADRDLKSLVDRSTQNLVLNFVPSQPARSPPRGCTPACLHILAPRPLAQALTHSLEEHKGEDCQQQEQEQELVHLRSGWQQDVRAGWSRGAQCPGSARMGCSRIWTVLCPSCGQKLPVHTRTGVFHHRPSPGDLAPLDTSRDKRCPLCPSCSLETASC